MTIDIGLLVLRIVVGLLFAGHGAQKLFGWFGGYGLNGVAGWLGSMGLKPARFWALMAGLAEFGGGILLLLGLFNPLGPLGIIAAMAMAIAKVHWSKGLWVTDGGVEYPLVNIAVSAAIALAGPGAYSIDAILNLTIPAAFFWIGLATILVVTVAVAGNRQAAASQTSA